SFFFRCCPIWIQHARFLGSDPTLRRVAPGNLGAADLPATEMVYLSISANIVTQPTMYTSTGPILHPGGKVTTMGGGTTMGATGPLLLQPIRSDTTPSGGRTGIGQFTTSYGFAHTTGTVFAQQNIGTGGSDFFTFMGYDKRTPLGAGNIQTVAGG